MGVMNEAALFILLLASLAFAEENCPKSQVIVEEGFSPTEPIVEVFPNTAMWGEVGNDNATSELMCAKVLARNKEAKAVIFFPGNFSCVLYRFHAKNVTAAFGLTHKTPLKYIKMFVEEPLWKMGSRLVENEEAAEAVTNAGQLAVAIPCGTDSSTGPTESSTLTSTTSTGTSTTEEAPTTTSITSTISTTTKNVVSKRAGMVSVVENGTKTDVGLMSGVPQELSDVQWARARNVILVVQAGCRITVTELSGETKTHPQISSNKREIINVVVAGVATVVGEC